MRILLSIFFIFFLSSIVSSCADVAVTSAQVVYNRHTLKRKISDEYITMLVYQALQIKTDDFRDSNISIATFNGEVLLAGQVLESSQRTKAMEIVKGIEGVKEIHNLLVVGKPSSTLTRISDSWITAKIKSKLFSSDVESSRIKVVTENGTVYLMGILPEKEASVAVDIARNTDGVQGVVKIFSYLNVSKKLTNSDDLSTSKDTA